MVLLKHVFILAAISLSVVTSSNTIRWIRTAKGNNDRLSVQNNLTFESDFHSDVTIHINRSMRFQTILGFGGAFTDSASYVFSKLNKTLQIAVLNMYFSDKGLQYNMARLPIGACDFSLKHYTYDDTKDDVNLTHFSIDHDKDQIIPFIKQAIQTRQSWTKETFDIVASPWSPPAWMKKLDISYCPFSCVDCQLKDKYQPTWANYFSKFITAYGEVGIDIWGVTVQNEPGACPIVYEGMHFTPETQRDYIKTYLGPTLTKDHPDVKILIYDHNKDKVVEWAKTVYSDKDAAQYVWGTAVHWYSGDDFQNLNTTHNLYPDIPILATEATVAREEHPKDPKWEHGEHYAHDIIGDMNNWVVGFIDWNLLLDRFGGPNHAGPGECEKFLKCGSDAMLLADLDKQVLYPQVFYYYVGQISKYVPRGSVRIHTDTVGTTLENIGFITPDKEVVVVIMNTGDESVKFKLKDYDHARAVNVTALPHSIQTFIYSY